jgi:hypothetical protein
MTRTIAKTILAGLAMALCACGGGGGDSLNDDNQKCANGSCTGSRATLTGRACDTSKGEWLAGATVTLNDTNHTSTTTDGNGGYKFENLNPGSYDVTISASSYNSTQPVILVGGATKDLSPTSCGAGKNGVRGRVCAGTNYFLYKATVSGIDKDGATVSVSTAADGSFLIANLPTGKSTLTAKKGPFSMDFDVNLSGGVSTLTDPISIKPKEVVAVVLGDYDGIPELLSEFGFDVRNEYTDSSRNPVVVNGQGVVDIIKAGATNNAAHPDFWFTGFVNDPVWMSKYRAIFIGCGVDDTALIQTLNNKPTSDVTRVAGYIYDYVAAGNSLYVSDYASEILGIDTSISANNLFGQIKWYGDPDAPAAGTLTHFAHANRQGTATGPSVTDVLSASVLDADLKKELGDKTTVSVNLNEDYWAIAKPAAQQGFGLRIFLKADNVSVHNTATVQAGVPLIMQFHVGASEDGGRITFTSVHHQAGGDSPDLQNVLRALMFEL